MKDRKSDVGIWDRWCRYFCVGWGGDMGNEAVLTSLKSIPRKLR
jgi:hypothetical protein